MLQVAKNLRHRVAVQFPAALCVDQSGIKPTSRPPHLAHVNRRTNAISGKSSSIFAEHVGAVAALRHESDL